MVAARTRHGKSWQRPYFRLTAKTGLLHRSKRRAQVGSLFDHLVGGRERCGISIPPMSLVGLGCAKTPALAPRVEISLSNCISESQIILYTRGWMPCWRIVFSTFRGCMSFYTARVIHVIPAIPPCPVRPKSGHSANARVLRGQGSPPGDRHRITVRQQYALFHDVVHSHTPSVFRNASRHASRPL